MAPPTRRDEEKRVFRSNEDPKKRRNPPKLPRRSRESRESRETEKGGGKKDHPCSGGYLSNDGFLWTDTNPDVKLIEPPILVSVNYNYLEFSRKETRPPERRTVCLINHGDYPIAFQILTTDNYSYFVDRRNGVIPPRQTGVNAVVRMANVAVVNVFHRPHKEYKEDERAAFFSVPHKDKMFIKLAPQMCQTFSPEAIFHNERCYEKLRVMLRYSGIELKPDDKRPKQLLLNAAPGWATWKDDEEKRQKNAKQIAAFRKMEQTIQENASKEAIEDEVKKPILVKRTTPVMMRKTPSPGDGRRREGFQFKNMFRHLNPFGKEEKKIEMRKREEMPKTPKKEPISASPGQQRKSTEPPAKKFEEMASPKRPKEQKDKPIDAPSPKELKKSKEQKEKLIEPPTPKNRKSKDSPFLEMPTPHETRKSKETKEKVVDAPSPAHNKKSKSKSFEDPKTPPPQHHKKSIEKSHTVSPAVHTPKANSPQANEMKTLKPKMD